MSGQLLDPSPPSAWLLTPRRHSVAHGLEETRVGAELGRRRSIHESISSLTRTVSTGLRLAVKRNSHVQLDEFNLDRRAVETMMVEHYQDQDIKISKLLCRRSSTEGGGEEHHLEVWLKRGGERRRLDLLVRLLHPGDRENKVYSTVVEDLRRFLRAKGDDPLPLPLSYRLQGQDSDSKAEVLVTENLAAQGYRPASLREGDGLDYEHAVLAVSGLARIHAVSYCYTREEEVDVLEQYPALAITPGPAVSADTLLRLENIFQQNPKFQPHAQLFVAFAKEEDHSLSLQENLATFGVLCHGDFCRDHLLFQYKSELESQLFCSDMVAQDLSLAHYGPAPLDLLQFVFTSLDPEVRQEFLPSLVCSVYYDTLASLVTSLCPSLPLFSKQEFLQETDRLLLHGFLAGLKLQTQLYEAELKHLLPSSSPPSYTEYRDRVLAMVRDLLQFRSSCRVNGT